MNYWLIAKYLGPVIVVVGLYFWHQGEVKETKQASYDAGYAAAEKVCTDETVPAAQKAEREVCRRNSEITEASNATDLAAKDAATARAMRMLDQLRRSYTATPCVPVGDLASVHQPGAVAVPPAGGNGRGLGIGFIAEFARKCQVRNDEFLGARQFLLNERANAPQSQ